MKKYLVFFSACTVLSFTGCSNEQSNNLNRHDVTDAIKEEYHLAAGASRGPADMVDELYQELTAQNEDLVKLEKNFDVLRKEQAKALAPYMLYNGKSTQYYTNALSLSNGISDSLLKNSVELLIKKSQHQFTVQSATMNANMNKLQLAYRALEDQYRALKIILTLDLIEKYQAQKIPPTPSYSELIQQMDQHMQLIDSLKQAK
jgi:hypothetical protein